MKPRKPSLPFFAHVLITATDLKPIDVQQIPPRSNKGQGMFPWLQQTFEGEEDYVTSPKNICVAGYRCMGRSGKECHLLVYCEQPKMSHFYLDLGTGQKVQRGRGVGGPEHSEMWWLEIR